MDRYKKLEEGTYYGYGSNLLQYVTDKVSKSKFIKLVCDQPTNNTDGPGWMRDRIMEGANQKALKAIADNPDALVVVMDRKTDEVIRVIK